MATEKTFNGWTNYATWRVNLEIIEGLDIVGMYPLEVEEDDAYTLSKYLQEYADEIICEYGKQEGLAVQYARAFMEDVNWYEIAEHILDDIKAEAV